MNCLFMNIQYQHIPWRITKTVEKLLDDCDDLIYGWFDVDCGYYIIENNKSNND